MSAWATASCAAFAFDGGGVLGLLLLAGSGRLGHGLVRRGHDVGELAHLLGELRNARVEVVNLGVEQVDGRDLLVTGLLVR